jgi:hypothetical protein
VSCVCGGACAPLGTDKSDEQAKVRYSDGDAGRAQYEQAAEGEHLEGPEAGRQPAGLEHGLLDDVGHHEELQRVGRRDRDDQAHGHEDGEHLPRLAALGKVVQVDRDQRVGVDAPRLSPHHQPTSE